jgi:acyl carrier protein
LSVAELIRRLRALVEKTSNGLVVAGPQPEEPDSIRRLGLDSLGMLNFLVAVEDEFGIEWGDDVPKEVLASFGSMAAYVADELGVPT